MSWTGQKSDPEPFRPTPPATPQVSQGTATTAHGPATERGKAADIATIGKSLEIKGELTGSENLTIEGKVDGRIVLHGHDVTIGPDGRVNAEVHARSVVVGGSVRGNITAGDKVELVATGSMVGDIRAPRVVLADGARFKGSIDMDGKPAAAAKPVAATVAKPASVPSPALAAVPASVPATVAATPPVTVPATASESATVAPK